MVGNTAMQIRTWPSLGVRFANTDDQQMYEGDGQQWLAIGEGGAFPLSDLQKQFINEAAILPSAMPSGMGPGSGVGGGGGRGGGGSSPGPQGVSFPPSLFFPPAGGVVTGMDTPILVAGRGDSNSQSIQSNTPPHFYSGSFSFMSEGTGMAAPPGTTPAGGPNTTFAASPQSIVVFPGGVTFHYHVEFTVSDGDSPGQWGMQDGLGNWGNPIHFSGLIPVGGKIISDGNVSTNIGQPVGNYMAAEMAGFAHIPKVTVVTFWFDKA